MGSLAWMCQTRLLTQWCLYCQKAFDTLPHYDIWSLIKKIHPATASEHSNLRLHILYYILPLFTLSMSVFFLFGYSSFLILFYYTLCCKMLNWKVIQKNECARLHSYRDPHVSSEADRWGVLYMCHSPLFSPLHSFQPPLFLASS